MQTEVADDIIIRRVIQGQSNAFGVLVERYQYYVFTLVLRYVPEREQAEELAQDVFVKAYTRLKDFRSECKFSTWLYTIVHTICLSFLRKKTSLTMPYEEEQLIGLTAERTGNPIMRATEQRSQRKLIEIAISLLHPSDAELLTLFYQAEQSLDEISIITGISAGTLKVKLHRARQKLKDILIKRFPAEVLNLNHA